METLAKNFFDKLPIIITRPFNYTGVGQAEHFLIPKIVKHFKEKKEEIELGNIHVSREFNDIADIVKMYQKLLTSNAKSLIVNLCSSKPVSLLEVIKQMENITKHKITIKINQKFVRKNELKILCGSTDKLFATIGKLELTSFQEMLTNYYNEYEKN
jgi:nucleoside-diphosphate-sugar epimerase